MNKPLATFTAYLDESGTHEGSSATVVAGYASSVRRWREFEADWPSLLTRHGLSALHTKEINGWRQDRRTALVGDVLQLLGKNALFGTAAIIYEADYREVYPRGERVHFFDTKYGMCFRTCMVKMSKIIRDQWPGQKVSFVLEDGNRNKGNAHGSSSFQKAAEGPSSAIHWGTLILRVSRSLGLCRQLTCLRIPSIRQLECAALLCLRPPHSHRL